MKLFLISDNVDTYTGMRLAGVEGVVVHERDEVQEALEAAVKDEEIGIVIITEKLKKLCPDLVYNVMLNRSRPLIVGIADRHGNGRPMDSIAGYVRNAIGLKI
jgi:V/A-type H+-transporting ATPase subunit F